MLGIYEEEEIRAIAEQVRHFTKTENQYTTATMPLGVSEVYNAGKELSTRLFGLYILKEPITPEDLIVDSLDEVFPADSVYAYFYDSRINDYVYLPIEALYRTGDFYDWNTTDGYTAYSKVLRDGKWVYNWYIESTGESGEGLYPDIKGRIIVFTKPTVVSENFYNLFMATTNGTEENYDEGKQAEYDRFWNAYQENGTRTDFAYAFYGEGWSDETFKPKYPLMCKGTGADYMFANSKLQRSPYLLNIDFSQCTRMSSTFISSRIVELGVLDFSKVTNFTQTFTYTYYLEKIEKMIVNASATFSNNCFSYCTALTDIAIEGEIGNIINFQWSTQLSKASIISIINALSDSTSGLSITLSKTARDNAFENTSWIKLASSKPNWTISLI